MLILFKIQLIKFNFNITPKKPGGKIGVINSFTS